jgi:phosphoenolpyruvate phosphomutase
VQRLSLELEEFMISVSERDQSKASLRTLIGSKDLVTAMATHSPLSAMLAAEAGFDALWASGFELSALHGLPDISLITMTQHLETMRAIAGRVSLPIIADVDTGFGNALNVIHTVREYERAGAGALVIEDKAFPKVTSLVVGGRQDLVRIAEFQGKIAAACATRRGDLLIVARVEALIAGLGEAEALKRAEAYEEAGADLILIHSKQKTPDEIESFVGAWTGRARLVLVPTAYPEMTEPRIRALGGKVAIVIYGNHAIRASVAAMRETFRTIRAEGGMENVQRRIASVEEIFALQDMGKVKEDEQKYLK